jgi:ribosomal protein L10
MAVSKAKKVEQLAVLEAHLKEANSVAFTSNTKVTVLEVSALKRDLEHRMLSFSQSRRHLSVLRSRISITLKLISQHFLVK